MSIAAVLHREIRQMKKTQDFSLYNLGDGVSYGLTHVLRTKRNLYRIYCVSKKC